MDENYEPVIWQECVDSDSTDTLSIFIPAFTNVILLAVFAESWRMMRVSRSTLTIQHNRKEYSEINISAVYGILWRLFSKAALGIIR